MPRFKNLGVGAVFFIIFIIAALVLCRFPASSEADEPFAWPEACGEPFWLGDQQVLTCLPETFNGTLVLYAHGYISPQEPIALPMEEIGPFASVIESLLALGYGFATTSYSKNGYAVEQAEGDLNALTDYYKNTAAPGRVTRVILTGASEGGLITAMQIEKHPDIYDGGLAMCAPIGGMPHQLRYVGDFRVLFDVFFPEVFEFPFDPGDFQGLEDFYNTYDEACEIWESIYKPLIADVMAAGEDETAQLFNVAGTARGDAVEEDVDAAYSLLNFNICGTVDYIDDTAGASGLPYDNRFRWYEGSTDDAVLNASVERAAPDVRASVYARQYYQPTGDLKIPLVTLYSTQDPVVPFEHEMIYRDRVTLRGKSRFLTSIPTTDYGHCMFDPGDVLRAFLLLLTLTQ